MVFLSGALLRYAGRPDSSYGDSGMTCNVKTPKQSVFGKKTAAENILTGEPRFSVRMERNSLVSTSTRRRPSLFPGRQKSFPMGMGARVTKIAWAGFCAAPIAWITGGIDSRFGYLAHPAEVGDA